jgi:penicillin-insensitive murein endopeptidase
MGVYARVFPSNELTDKLGDMTRSSLCFAIGCLLLLGGCASEDPIIRSERFRAKNPVSEAKRLLAMESALGDPKFKGLPYEAIGGYANGCLRRSVKLPKKSRGFVLSNARPAYSYAHPLMQQFLTELGTYLEENATFRLIVGDVAGKRGGPIGVSHASHQTGLDVDIWLRTLAPGEERPEIRLKSVVDPKTKSIDPTLFTNDLESVMRIVAKSPMVQRVFVHSSVKRDLCEKYPEEDWLVKIRPWKSHNKHFHVRLYCPATNPRCLPQYDPVEDDCPRLLKYQRKVAASEFILGEAPNGELPSESGMDMDEEDDGQARNSPRACQELLR